MPSVYICPNGHSSTDPEYCSECGKKLPGSGAASGSVPAGGTSPSANGGQICPDCGTKRASPTAVFCEVCRYNFVTQTPWSPAASPAALAPAQSQSQQPPPLPPIPAPAADSAPPSVAPAPAISIAPAPAISIAPPPLPIATPVLAPDTKRYEAVVAVDASLYSDPDPAVPCPIGDPERVFPLDFAESLIGRRSERRGIFPEIDLSSDHGISSRHAILYRESGGGISILDVGSTNGTQLNGQDLSVGVRTPLKEGDQITIGCWTRMTIRAKPDGAQQP